MLIELFRHRARYPDSVWNGCVLGLSGHFLRGIYIHSTVPTVTLQHGVHLSTPRHFSPMFHEFPETTQIAYQSVKEAFVGRVVIATHAPVLIGTSFALMMV